MTLVIYFPLLVCLVGVVVWFMNVPTPKPWAEFGRIMFWVGLLAFLITYVGPTLSVQHH
jgi:hypothetical protein